MSSNYSFYRLHIISLTVLQFQILQSYISFAFDFVTVTQQRYSQTIEVMIYFTTQRGTEK